MSMKVTRDEFVGVDRMGEDELRDLAHELMSENAKLREFATLAWQVLTRNDPLYVWQGMVDDARELGLEEMTDGRADD